MGVLLENYDAVNFQKHIIFVLGRKHFWKGAEEILEAKYLQKAGVLKLDTGSVSVQGICGWISKLGVRNEPHVINFTFTWN